MLWVDCGSLCQLNWPPVSEDLGKDAGSLDDQLQTKSIEFDISPPAHLPQEDPENMMTNSNEDGVDKVLANRGGYVYIMESVSVDYEVSARLQSDIFSYMV